LADLISPEEREKFEMYLFEMDDVLEPFIEDADKAGFTLDYSLDSLHRLEQHWLSRKGDADAERLLQRSVRYFGEVFRKNVGGKWQLCDSHPNNVYFKLPIVSRYSHSQPHLEFCPLIIFTNFVNRERRGILRRAAEAHMEYAD
jgi:hypothetical protein